LEQRAAVAVSVAEQSKKRGRGSYEPVGLAAQLEKKAKGAASG